MVVLRNRWGLFALLNRWSPQEAKLSLAGLEVARLSHGVFFRPETCSRSRAPVTRIVFSPRRSLAKSRACPSDLLFALAFAREVARLSLGFVFRPGARSRSRAPVTRIFFSAVRSLAKSRACHADDFLHFRFVLLFRRALGNRRFGYGSRDPGSSFRDKNRRYMSGCEMYRWCCQVFPWPLQLRGLWLGLGSLSPLLRPFASFLR